MQTCPVSGSICQLWNDKKVDVYEEQLDIELSIPEASKLV